MTSLRVLLVVGAAAWRLQADPAATTTRYQPALDEAFSHLYSSDFDGAQAIVNGYIAQHPGDPVAYSVKASGYLFSELHRLGILQADFFEDDKAIGDKRKLLRADPKIHDAFYAALNQAQSISDEDLRHNPNNTNALFAKCLANGNLSDYMALIEKRQMSSLAVTKDGYRDAKRLLAVAPDFYDAKLTTGFTEYLIGSIPLVVRWFVRFDDVKGDKEQGIRNLEVVASKGHYLRSFAKILLATAHLRAKDYNGAKTILRDLTTTYPRNQLLKHELERLQARM